MTESLFFIFAAMAIVSALMVILNRNPIYSAVSLVITLFSLAGIFLLLEAYFLAVVQIIVYAGAIMVLFLFVIMLLNPGKEAKFLSPKNPRIFIITLLSMAFIGMIITLVSGSVNYIGEAASSTGDLGTTRNIGLTLFTKYLLPFEIASLLLLVALVGAVLMTKRHLR
ncbi:NADH-quinone oxidoreductase subunit J [Candidatus Marinimicrobia bacterium MT.SAG.3]|nr:NADH-quinone oxidoreductase subunit J [Candidatus Marinimicrobia bacterium MT.SAG.3]TFB13324.1 NADH-quinone oxidoreductase subunit J [Candidatus Marinimicrobia bacterium MT.SAG.4]